MSDHVPFRQHDLTRAIKAVLAAGLAVSEACIEPGGRIRVVTGEAGALAPIDPYAAWKASRGKG